MERTSIPIPASYADVPTVTAPQKQRQAADIGITRIMPTSA